MDFTEEQIEKVVLSQFPEYADLEINPVSHQGHDNRSYRLGEDLLLRMPTSEVYALKVPLEHKILPLLAKHLSVPIPKPIVMGSPSEDYPYFFSIYRWLEGESLEQVDLDDASLEALAYELAFFLKELQAIRGIEELLPGQHNWWRGEHISVYEEGFHKQIKGLKGSIDTSQALYLWKQALKTKWRRDPVWIHGDFAVGNILVSDKKLSAVIDFGGMATGDPACDLVVAWTLFRGKSRDIFIKEMDVDPETWLRAKAWVLWKASFELCQQIDSSKSFQQQRIIEEILAK